MKIKLKSLRLENFKGTKALDIVFSNKTQISGQNASGKTTIFDAFTWLLFNKNSAGEEKFNIRPLDENGNRIDNVEIKVAAVLDVDGKEVELSKVQKQNWVTKRGTQNKELQGNVNSFEIDGYPKSEAEYKAYISELVAEDLFKMLTNPQHFVNMKWKDQRDILMKFVSDISDVELAQQKPEFADLLTELEKAPSTDDIQKKFSKALSEWKKKQTEIPVRIDELSKSLVSVDVAEMELAKADLERKIAEIDEKISNSGSAVDSLCGESMELQFAINAMYTEANDKLAHERRQLESIKYEAENIFNETHQSISEINRKIANNQTVIAMQEEKKPDINKRFKDNQAKVFDETPYLFDESAWVFDENSTVCSLCGQSYPAEKIAEIKADFECRKANAKADAEKKLTDARERFNADKEAVKKAINEEAGAIKAKIEELTNENKTLESQLDALRKDETDALSKKNQIEKQIAELPVKPDMSGNAEYQQKKARYDELEKQIAGLKDTTSVADTFKEERKAYVAELDAVKAEIAKASRNVEIEERIGELEEEQKEVAQKVADQEKMLYLLEQFIKAKMMMISESINKHFEMVDFLLFKNQLNGGMTETCECMYKGVPYSSLNTAAKIQCGLDIIRSLSNLYDVYCPVFIDNRESCTNIPDMKCQVISMYVAPECKELVVKWQD